MSEVELLFSVIIPTYNHAHTLARAVTSVLHQSGGDYELIVIDDGSTDDTAQVAAQLRQYYADNFAYHTQANSGAAAARNRGIEASNGRYLVFLDADDALTDSALGCFRDAIKSHPNTGILIGGHISVSTENGSATERYHPPGILYEDAKSRLQAYLLDKKVSISHGACAIRRNVFDHYKYPSKFRNNEDIPIFSYALANFPATIIDRPIALIHKHPNSLRHNMDYARGVGVDLLVEEIFAPERMPGKLQSLKKRFRAQRNLSLSRTCYVAGDYAACRLFYLNALRNDCRVLFKWSYLSKVVRALFKTQPKNRLDKPA